MKYFEMYKNDADNYIYLVCLSQDNFLNYIKAIENLIKNNKYRNIIIDQLIITGNGYNRFVKCDINNRRINLISAKTIEKNPNFDEITKKAFKKNKSIMESSSLARSTKDYYLYG